MSFWDGFIAGIGTTLFVLLVYLRFRLWLLGRLLR